MKWLWMLLCDPVKALDLADGNGDIDHGKIIGFFAYMTMLAVVLLGLAEAIDLIPLGHMIALITAAFGWAAWRVFLKSRNGGGDNAGSD